MKALIAFYVILVICYLGGNSKTTGQWNVPVRVDLSKFKLPTFFGYAIDQKLLNKKPIDHKDYSAICRVLAQSIEMHTMHPHMDSTRLIVQKLFDRFPSLILSSEADFDSCVI